MVCMMRSRPENWLLFEHALRICADILKSSKFRPSCKQQGRIMTLLYEQVKNCYGEEFVERLAQEN